MKKRDRQIESEKHAREYIDKIAAINRRHGMDKPVTKERYDRAVEAAARVFRGLRSSTPR